MMFDLVMYVVMVSICLLSYRIGRLDGWRKGFEDGVNYIYPGATVDWDGLREQIRRNKELRGE